MPNTLTTPFTIAATSFKPSKYTGTAATQALHYLSNPNM